MIQEYIVIRDNRDETKILKICDKKQQYSIYRNFKWRKTPIPLEQLAKYPFYTELEVGNHQLHPAPQDVEQEDSFEGEGNKFIYTLNESQRLQQDTINEMKSTLKPQAIIEEIVANNEQFEKRTTYSKQKYIRDKKKKYCFYIHSQPVSLSNVHEYYFNNHPQGIYHIRWDMLALLLLRAGPYHSVLLGEHTDGLLLAAIIQRNPTRITSVSKSLKSLKTCSIVKQLNLSPTNVDFATWDTLPSAEYDNFILVGEYDFKALARKCTPLLRKGAILTFFCLSNEPLVEAMGHLRDMNYIHIRLSDTFTREYQVLKNRTHPMVSMHARSGYLLTAIRV